MKKLSKKKVILVALIFVSLIAVIILGIYISSSKTTSVETVGGVEKNLNSEEEIIEEVKEEIVSVAVDTSEEESLLEGEGEEVTFEDKTVTVPKSTVAPVNSAEDAESGKKTGGETVSQGQVDSLFQNEGVTSKGIDVSAHQGKINWAEVAASGVEFAMIRVGFRGQTSGGIYEDAYFKTNMAGAAANGIKIGVYFYSTAINENEALEEAVWVVKKISTYRITYPVVYDFEDFNSKRCANVGGAQATSNALTFLSFVQSNGYEPMMYANKSDITNRLSRGSFSNMKFWLAHYTTQTDYAGNYQMWQYTSKGSVPGISGNVDMNIAYFSYGTTAAAKHTHNYSEEVKNSYKAPTCTAKGSRVVRCSCGDSHTEEIAMVDHKFGDWKVKTAATTESEGVQARTCSVCGKEETKAIAKLTPTNNTSNNQVSNTNSISNSSSDTTHTHDWKENTSKSKTATCSEDGYTYYECSGCNETKQETIKATGNHNYVETSRVEATSETEGLITKKCSECGNEITEKIQKLSTETNLSDENAN